MVRKEKKRRSENQEVMFVYRFFFPPPSLSQCGSLSLEYSAQYKVEGRWEGRSKNSHESMQMAHRDEFPFTDLSLLMGIREGRFNWLATACTRTLSRGCGEE